METLQILGWIYLGVVIGSITGVIGLGLFQGGRVASFKREIYDLNAVSYTHLTLPTKRIV